MPEQQTDVKQNSMLCLWVEELRIIETDIAASIAATPDLAGTKGRHLKPPR